MRRASEVLQEAREIARTDGPEFFGWKALGEVTGLDFTKDDHPALVYFGVALDDIVLNEKPDGLRWANANASGQEAFDIAISLAMSDESTARGRK